MLSKLEVLALSCKSLQNLKYKEADYKRAAVVTACDSLSKLKGVAPMHKRAGIIMPALAVAGASALTYLGAKHGREMLDNAEVGLNRINSDWGTNATLRRINKLPPAQREREFLARFGFNPNMGRYKDKLDAMLWADNAYAKRRANRLNSTLRGGRYLDDAYRRTYADYSSGLNEAPRYGYGFLNDDPYSGAVDNRVYG